jgi:HK97 family phage major capsid protein
VSTKLAVPNTADGLQEALTNRATMKTIMDEGSLPEFMTNYVAEFGRKNVDVQEQVDDAVNRAMASYARDRGAELLAGGGKRKATAADVRAQRQSGTYKSDRVGAGAKLDGKFEDLWDFLTCVSTKSIQTGADHERRALVEAAMSSTEPASGGFLIPDEFRATLMQVALETALVRPRATVIPMTSLRVSMPIVDSTSNVSSVYGGIIGYWAEEGAALTQSQPTFGRIVLEAKKLTAYTAVPNELRRDSAISVETLLNTMMPQGISWFEDIAFLFGSGVGEPLGVLNPNNAAILSVAAQGGQPSGTILWENIVAMYARMLPSSLANAVWVVPPNALPELFTMALSVGTGGSILGPIAANNGTGAPVMQLLGLPIVVSEKVTALGGAGDVSLVDFSQYLIGDRMAMEAEQSADYLFGNDMMAYRFIERVDGRPWLQSAITPRNGGPTLSPYVQLAARP